MAPKLAAVGPLKADSVDATLATVMVLVPAARAVPSSSVKSTVIVGLVGPLMYVCVTTWPLGLPETGPVLAPSARIARIADGDKVDIEAVRSTPKSVGASSAGESKARNRQNCRQNESHTSPPSWKISPA